MSSFIGLSAADEAAALRSDVQLATTRPIPTTQVPAVGDLAFYGESFQTFMNGNLPGQQEQQQMQQHGSGQPLADTQDAEDPEDRKRRRVTRACDICWKKKIKCLNDSQSACIHCRSNGFTCTYFRDAKRRGPKALNPFEKVCQQVSRNSPRELELMLSVQQKRPLLQLGLFKPSKTSSFRSRNSSRSWNTKSSQLTGI